MDMIIINIIQTVAIAWLVWDRTRIAKRIPSLKEGEHVAVVPKEHSNVTVVREGDRVIMVDEEFQKLDINKIVK